MPKASVIVTKRNAYNPSAYEMQKVRKSVQRQMTLLGVSVIRAPVMVVLQHYFSAPVKFKSEESRLEQDGLPYTKRPDFDNCCKLINDALNGVAWLDDSQICAFFSCKLVTKELDGFSLLHVTELPKTKMNFDEIVTVIDNNLIYPGDFHGVTF